MTSVIAADKAVQKKVTEIVNSCASYGDKYRMLDELYFAIINHHPQGMAADVLQVVSEAQTLVIRKQDTQRKETEQWHK